jgi:guanylate kinase
MQPALSPTLPAALTGRFFILAGPTGAGKNTLMAHALARFPSLLRQLPTATSRAMRPTEQEGREHVFLTPEAFEARVAAGEFLEHQRVHGRWYGILRSTLETMLATQPGTIADIDVLGAHAARQAYPEQTVLVFVQPPSLASLYQRLTARGDSPAEFARRILRVPLEMRYAREARYTLVNEDAGAAGETLCALIEAELNGRPVSLPPPAPLKFEYRVVLRPQGGTSALTWADGTAIEAVFQPDDLLDRALLTLARSAGLEAAYAARTAAPDEPLAGFTMPDAVEITQADDATEHIRFVFTADLGVAHAPAGTRWQEQAR